MRLKICAKILFFKTRTKLEDTNVLEMFCLIAGNVAAPPSAMSVGQPELLTQTQNGLRPTNIDILTTMLTKQTRYVFTRVSRWAAFFFSNFDKNWKFPIKREGFKPGGDF